MTYPYIVHRTYLCGHPDEYVEVDRLSPTKRNEPPVIQHTLIPPLKPSPQSNSYQQAFERCTPCAREHQAQERKAFPSHPIRKIAAHQSQMQGDLEQKKDGFLQVLSRYRFQEAPRTRIVWKDENPNDRLLPLLKAIHDKAEAERNIKPHAEVPYRARRDKHVVGPEEANKALPSTYTIMINVHEDLLPPCLPTPPPEPQRHSDSALLGDHHYSHPAGSILNSHASNRDTVGTSLSLGDKPRDSAQVPSRIQSSRGRGGQPLPIFRSRRDMLKERVANLPVSGSPRGSSLRPSDGLRLSDSSEVTDSAGTSQRQSQDSANQQRNMQRGSSGAGHSSQESPGRSSYEDRRRGRYDTATRNPYKYSPRESTDSHDDNAREPPLRRYNSANSHSETYENYRTSQRHVSESSHDSSHTDSTRRVSEGASHHSFGNLESPRGGDLRSLDGDMSPIDSRNTGEGLSRAVQGNGSRRVRPRANTDQVFHPNVRGQDSDSDTSSVGRW